MRKIRFDEPSHTYWVDDVEKPAVSKIITKVLKNDEPIPEYALPAIEKGRFAHKAIFYLNTVGLDMSSLDPVIEKYVKSYQLWKDKIGFIPDKNETIFYNEGLDYCGTRDVTGQDKYGNHLLLDYKTGGIYDYYEAQLGGYCHDESRSYQVGIVQLFKTGKIGRHLLYDRDRAHILWEACVAIYDFKVRRGAYARQ